MAGEGALVDEVDEDVATEIEEHEDEDLELDDVEDDGLVPEAGVDDEGDGESDDSTEVVDEDAPVALDALEAEELEIVETDESATMLVDEASEIMAIRREEMTMDIEDSGKRGDEFTCQSCFLVLKSSQLANKRKMLCVDCA